ncbi:hypothetical protein Plhal304r1_c043g0122811 [Plasmopara halstedii]
MLKRGATAIPSYYWKAGPSCTHHVDVKNNKGIIVRQIPKAFMTLLRMSSANFGLMRTSLVLKTLTNRSVEHNP